MYESCFPRILSKANEFWATAPLLFSLAPLAGHADSDTAGYEPARQLPSSLATRSLPYACFPSRCSDQISPIGVAPKGADAGAVAVDMKLINDV